MPQESKYSKFNLRILDPYFGVDPESYEAGRLRASQIGSISRTMPLMTVAKILCACVVYFAFHNEPAGWFLEYWTLALLILGALGLNHIYQNKKRKPVITASKNAYTKATKAVVLSGLLWGIMPIALYPSVPTEDRIIIIALMSGLMGSGAFSLYTVPRVMMTWSALLFIGSAIALILVPTAPNMIVLALLGLYICALVRASYSMASKFTNNVITNIEAQNHSETISLLLKDFSENASDWLWELNATGQVTRGGSEFLKSLKVAFTSISPGDYQGNFLGENNQVLNMRSVDALRSKYKDQESFRDIVVSSSSSLGARWVSLSGKPLYDLNNTF